MNTAIVPRTYRLIEYVSSHAEHVQGLRNMHSPLDQQLGRPVIPQTHAVSAVEKCSNAEQ